MMSRLLVALAAFVLPLSVNAQVMFDTTRVTCANYLAMSPTDARLFSAFMSEGTTAPALQAAAIDAPPTLPAAARRLIRALRPLIEQPDATFLWAPPITVNGRAD